MTNRELNLKTKIEKFFQRKATTFETPPKLSPGVPAPDFVLEASNGERIRLSQFHGRPVILAFYPADQTPVCSNQLALYNEALHLFEDYEAQLLAISVDDVASHQDFSESLNLRFPLLADDNPAGDVAGRYGVFNPGDHLSERALFVVDHAGTIRWSEVSPRDINPGAHGILQALESLR
jgi:peroxiredoxin (alkyl hydroperoxide reductase subunit C)